VSVSVSVSVPWNASLRRYYLSTYVELVVRTCTCSGDDKRRLPPKTVFVNVKRCPACHYPIEKNGGCPYMTCSRCGNDFCWQCRADLTTHNYSDCRQVPEIVSSSVSFSSAGPFSA